MNSRITMETDIEVAQIKKWIMEGGMPTNFSRIGRVMKLHFPNLHSKSKAETRATSSLDTNTSAHQESMQFSARYCNLSSWKVSSNEPSVQVAYFKVIKHIILRESALASLKDIILNLNKLYWKYVCVRSYAALNCTNEYNAEILSKIKVISSAQEELTVAIAHFRAISIQVTDAILAFRKINSKYNKSDSSISIFYKDTNYLIKMLHDTDFLFNIFIIRNWFEPGPVRTFVAGDESGVLSTFIGYSNPFLLPPLANDTYDEQQREYQQRYHVYSERFKEVHKPPRFKKKNYIPLPTIPIFLIQKPTVQKPNLTQPAIPTTTTSNNIAVLEINTSGAPSPLEVLVMKHSPPTSPSIAMGHSSSFRTGVSGNAERGAVRSTTPKKEFFPLELRFLGEYAAAETATNSPPVIMKQNSFSSIPRKQSNVGLSVAGRPLSPFSQQPAQPIRRQSSFGVEQDDQLTVDLIALQLEQNKFVSAAELQSNWQECEAIARSSWEVSDTNPDPETFFWESTMIHPLIVEATVGLKEVSPLRRLVPEVPEEIRMHCSFLMRVMQSEDAVTRELASVRTSAEALKQEVTLQASSDSLLRISNASLSDGYTAASMLLRDRQRGALQQRPLSPIADTRDEAKGDDSSVFLLTSTGQTIEPDSTRRRFGYNVSVVDFASHHTPLHLSTYTVLGIKEKVRVSRAVSLMSSQIIPQDIANMAKPSEIPIEHTSAVFKIQRIARGFIQRQKYCRLRQVVRYIRAALKIQRVMRGGLGRRRFRRIKKSFRKDQFILRKEILKYSHAATKIIKFMKHVVFLYQKANLFSDFRNRAKRVRRERLPGILTRLHACASIIQLAWRRRQKRIQSAARIVRWYYVNKKRLQAQRLKRAKALISSNRSNASSTRLQKKSSYMLSTTSSVRRGSRFGALLSTDENEISPSTPVRRITAESMLDGTDRPTAGSRGDRALSSASGSLASFADGSGSPLSSGSAGGREDGPIPVLSEGNLRSLTSKGQLLGPKASPELDEMSSMTSVTYSMSSAEVASMDPQEIKAYINAHLPAGQGREYSNAVKEIRAAVRRSRQEKDVSHAGAGRTEVRVISRSNDYYVSPAIGAPKVITPASLGTARNPRLLSQSLSKLSQQESVGTRKSSKSGQLKEALKKAFL